MKNVVAAAFAGLALLYGLPVCAQQASFNGPLTSDSSTPANLRLPVIFDRPQVPTDVTNTKTNIYQSEDLLLRAESRRGPKNQRIVERDPRFLFEPQWNGLSHDARVAMIQPGAQIAITNTLLIEREHAAVFAVPREKQFKHIVKDINAAAMPITARIKANIGTTYTVTEHDLVLNGGAVLVEAGPETTVLRTPHAGKMVEVLMKAGALCLVSNMDGRLIVANLADRGRDACSIFVFDDSIQKLRRLDAKAGQMWEFAARPRECAVVAFDPVGHVPISNQEVAELYRIHYPRLIKRYNLVAAIDTDTMRSVLKTAAAVAHIDRADRADNRFLQKQRKETLAGQG